jgi:hypothetical protein
MQRYICRLSLYRNCFWATFAYTRVPSEQNLRTRMSKVWIRFISYILDIIELFYINLCTLHCPHTLTMLHRMIHISCLPYFPRPFYLQVYSLGCSFIAQSMHHAVDWLSSHSGRYPTHLALHPLCILSIRQSLHHAVCLSGVHLSCSASVAHFIYQAIHSPRSPLVT